MAKATKKRKNAGKTDADRPNGQAPEVDGPELWERWRGEASARAYADRALPFDLHSGQEVPIFDDLAGMPQAIYDRFEFERSVAAVCDKALDEGFRLSIPCPPNYTVEATVRIAQRLSVKCCIRYDTAGERLWVWPYENREEREFAKRDELAEAVQHRMQDIRDLLVKGLLG